MEKIAFIPVRGGSKSIPLKNIKMLGGYPLVYWVAKAANDAKCIDKVIIATENEKIKNIVADFNLDKLEIYNRKKENATDTSSTESAIIEYIKNNNVSSDDFLFLIQATSPLLDSSHIDEMYEKFVNGKFDSALTCTKNKKFFWTNNGKSLNYDYKNRPRRQDFDSCLIENGACYINKISNILKYKNRLSGQIFTYIMPEYTSVEIDEPSDWIIMECLIRKYKKIGVLQPKIKMFISDCDGVLTDGGMYYSAKGDYLKKFNTKDGMGFKLLKNKGIITCIITGEKNNIVKMRATKLKIDELFMGIENKLDVVKKLCKKYRISMKEIAYIGDDINDLAVLKSVGYGFCVNNAEKVIKKYAKFITKRCGGEGALREAINILGLENINEDTI